MRHRLVLLAALALLLPALHPVAGQPERITALITQLGSESFLEREQARKDLETLGPPALGALRAATRAGDLETARRAADLIRVIEAQRLTRMLLTPTKVRLQVRDMPVLQAVEQLSRLSGVPLRIDGDRTVLAGKTVTLDTGAVTFWEALDHLNARAGLVEKFTVAAMPGDPSPSMIGTSYYQLDLMVRGKRSRRAPPPPLRVVPLPSKESVAAAAKKADENAAPATPIVPGRVVLTPSDGRRQVSYAGAARVSIQALRTPAGAAYDLRLVASAEPRLLGFTLLGVPTVIRAIDEHDQALTFIIDPAPLHPPRKTPSPLELLEALNYLEDLKLPAPPVARGVTIRLRGDRPARRLKELTGTLTAQVQVPDTTLVALDEICHAAGKSADLPGGGRLVIQAVRKTGTSPDNEAYQVEFQADTVPGTRAVTTGGRTVYVEYGPLGAARPELLDAQGRRLAIVNGPSFGPVKDAPPGPNRRVRGVVNFRREAGVGAPVRFTLTGTATPVIVVPFRFTDVPLR